MKRKVLRKVLLVLIIAGLAAICLFGLKIYEDSAEYVLPVIETSDIHGCLVDISSGDESLYQYRLAYLAHEIEGERKGGDVILLDTGDGYQENLLSNLLEGNSIKAYFNAMNYDGICIGNHEFDWGITKVIGSDATVGEYYLSETYSGKSDIPILCCDLYSLETGKKVPFSRDYVILSKTARSESGKTKTVNIAVFGYVDDYSLSVSKSQFEGYEIHPDDIRAIEEKAAELERSGQADASVLLCHVSPYDMEKILGERYAFDLVLCGHNHEANSGRFHNGVPYLNGSSHGDGYARADLSFRKGRVSVKNQKSVSIMSTRRKLYDVPENTDHFDRKILDLSHVAIDRVFEQYPAVKQKLGYIRTGLSDNIPETSDGETVKSRWAAGCLARAVGAEVGIINSTGVRGNVTLNPGMDTRNLTGGDILAIFPFGNQVSRLNITCEKLLDILNHRYLNDYDYLVLSDMQVWYDENRKARKVVLGDRLIYDGDWVESESTLVSIAVSSYLVGLKKLGLEGYVPENDPAAAVDNVIVTEYLLNAYGDGREIPVDTSVHFMKAGFNADGEIP